MGTVGEALFKSVVDSLPFAVCVLGPSRKVQLWNRPAEQMFQWPVREVLGRPDPTIPRDKFNEFAGLFDLALKGGRKVHLETTRERKDHRILNVNLIMIPLQGSSGPASLMMICKPVRPPQRTTSDLHKDAVEQSPKLEARAGIEGLTPREREIVALLVSGGGTTRALAQRLQIREQVVRNHLHRIYRQLRVGSRSELIALLSR